MLRSIFLVLCLTACGKKVPTDDPPLVPNDPLSIKMSLYESLQDTVRDPYGFIESDQCDSLLFTALASFNKPVNIRIARSENGQWFRTPDHLCYQNYIENLQHADDPTWTPLKPDSKSSISREMLLGVMWYAYIHSDLQLVESIYGYAIEHNWVMGDGLINRTTMSTSMMATLSQLIYKLGGRDHAERLLPVTWLPGATDFERHIQAWHILLRIRVYDTIEESAFKRLDSFVESQPNNPLYQYATNNVEQAIEILNSSPHYPNDRLPTSSDRCEPWLIQRDSDSKGYLPCDENRTHSGGELLALGFLILKGQ